MYKALTTLLSVILLLSITTAMAGIAPKLIHYQAVLEDAGGEPVTTETQVTFRIYDAATSKTILWEEARMVTPDEGGAFSISLGETVPVNEDVFSAAERWLGITVGTDSELTPRTRLASSPYSMRVETIDQSQAGTVAGPLTVSPSEGGSGDDAGLYIQNSVGENAFSMDAASDTPMFIVKGPGGDESAMTSTGIVTPQLNVYTQSAKSGDPKDCTGPNLLGLSTQGNSAVGQGNDLLSANNSFAVGLCNTIAGNKNSTFGEENEIGPVANSVIFGLQNTVLGSRSTAIGSNNYLADQANDCFVTGDENYVERVGGNIEQVAIFGYADTVTGLSLFSAAIGQAHHLHDAGYSSVTGGDSSTINSSWFSFIGSGKRNTIVNSSNATIGGGIDNTVSGNGATVPGGTSNTAAGENSFAAGRRAKANYNGSFVWADNQDADFASITNNQFLIRASGNVGINTVNPTHPLTVDGQIKSLTGGYVFPDGTVQSSAAASIADGWTDGGNYVYATSNNDSVGIGTSTPTEKLEVAGAIKSSSGSKSGESITIDAAALGGPSISMADATNTFFNVDQGGISVVWQQLHEYRGFYVIHEEDDDTMGVWNKDGIKFVANSTGDSSHDLTPWGSVIYNDVTHDTSLAISGTEIAMFDTIFPDKAALTASGLTVEDTVAFDESIIRSTGMTVGNELYGYDVAIGKTGAATTDWGMLVTQVDENDTLKLDNNGVRVKDGLSGDNGFWLPDESRLTSGSTGSVISMTPDSLRLEDGSKLGNRLVFAPVPDAVFRYDMGGTTAMAIDATGVGTSITMTDPAVPGNQVKYGPPDTVFKLYKEGSLVMSADATATSGQLVIGETGSSGDEVSLGPPGTVFKGKKAGTTVVEAGMTASGGWMELGRFDGTTTIDMRGNAGTVDCNMVSTGPLAMDQYGIACDTATSTQALDITAPAGTNVYSNYGQSAGANLPPGGGSWSSISDRNKKENFEDVDAQSLLEKVAAMPMTTWNYKSQDESIRHMGPMAQDFKAAFGVGEDDKHISTVDADGVALAAIQALYDRVKALESENAELKVTNSEMGARLDRIEKVLANQNSGSDKLAVNK